MKIHEFAIIASGLDPEAEDFEDRFFEAGCDDATLSFQKGVIIAESARDAVSFSKAVTSAYEAVLRAGATVERVEPDYLVSLSEIAERSGKTRQAISLYTNGERGQGFPPPVARVTSNHPLWDWEQVAEWLVERDALPKEELVRARVVKEANLHLEASDAPDGNFVRRLEALESVQRSSRARTFSESHTGEDRLDVTLAAVIQKDDGSAAIPVHAQERNLLRARDLSKDASAPAFHPRRNRGYRPHE